MKRKTWLFPSFLHYGYSGHFSASLFSIRMSNLQHERMNTLGSIIIKKTNPGNQRQHEYLIHLNE